MVSSPHETMHHFFRKETAMMVRNFQRLFHVPFPEARDIAVLDTDLTEIDPVERRVDTLMRVDTDEGNFLFAYEAQGKKDEKKPASWAYYVAHLHAKYQLQPVLFVLTQSRATARWAAQPIRLGLSQYPTAVVRPLVLGPDNVPLITDEKQAMEDPSLAVFSAIVHARGKRCAAILEMLARALDTIDADSAAMFAQFVESGLASKQARDIWRNLMATKNYFFRNPVAEGLREEGRVADRAEMTLRILEWRGLAVPDDVRERVLACTDRDQLTAWAERAMHVEVAGELFAD
ncbi:MULTISPECIES: hypothetical protein [unclassified Streptomyces]|uniref:hypothetical protein n=1 Tax=unclassified Streptomyces TaxID=2593676 RepID=UPI00278C2CD8|nr:MULTISPECIES: hypothetical protein [unclassified Streptomyces]